MVPNEFYSDHFPVELKSKETQFRVSFDFNSIGKWFRINFIFNLINLAAVEKTKRKNIIELEYCTGMSPREIQK